MTTTFVASPGLVPNRTNTKHNSSPDQKPSHERSYLKSRRNQHRSAKRQTILGFLDKNLEDLDRDSSPTERRRNGTTTETTTTSTKFSLMNAFRKSNNSNNLGSSSHHRRISKRRQEKRLENEERKQKELQQKQASSHDAIIQTVLDKYPKHQCQTFEDHLNFAIAELTTTPQTKHIHMTPETISILKKKLQQKLKEQLEPKDHNDKDDEEADNRDGLHDSNSSSIENDFDASNRRRRRKQRQQRSESPSKSSTGTTTTRKSKHKVRMSTDSSNKRSSGHKQHSELSKSRHKDEEHTSTPSSSTPPASSAPSTTPAPISSAPSTTTTPAPTSSSNLKPPESSRSLAVPVARPVSTKSLKGTLDKDDTSVTAEDDDSASTNIVQDLLVFDGDGHLGTYSGPLCPTSGKPHGASGKMQYKSKEDFKVKKYSGGWYQGLFHGSGTLLKTNGDIYHGQFMDGQIHGMGKYKYSNQVRCFEGRHVQGQRVEGTMQYNDGSIYKGQWYKGKRHGRGQYTFSDGSIYKGEFSEDKIHGIGQLKWPDGSKYIGEWNAGNRHGTGKEYKANGDLRFQGRWKDGKEVK